MKILLTSQVFNVLCPWRLLLIVLSFLNLVPAMAIDVTVDNDTGFPAYSETGIGWQSSVTPGYNEGTYRFNLGSGDTATWVPAIPFSGVYNVSAIFRTGANRPSRVIYTVSHVTGQSIVGINQQGSGDMTEVPLGSYSFPAGFDTRYYVRLASVGGSATIADAICFRMASSADDAPVITGYVRMPGKVDSATSVSIRGLVVDEGSITSAGLSYIVHPSTAVTTITAYDDGAHGDLAAGDSIYGAVIPPQPDGTSITAWLRAWDNLHQEGQSEPRVYYVGRNPGAEFRALWADSWAASFLNPSQADDLVDTARAANINVLMPEVRKVGDAYYDSAYEPRADNISGPPGYDPLQYLIDHCHETSEGKKLQVHAWFVMNRIAVGFSLPTSHVLVQHPEYEMLKNDGSIGSTRYLDPGHPGAVDHNVAVVLDCVTKYDIDGYHFDYIRYPETAGYWGYNPVSIARFNAVHDRTGQPDDWDPLWKAWRRECVSLMVKKIYVKAWKIKPHMVSTAATVNWGWSYDDFSKSAPYNHVYQDWSGWLQDGIIDYNSLMSYSRLTDPARHQGWSWRSIADENKRGSVIGVGVYLSANIPGSMDQLHFVRSSGAAGMNIYDWGSEVNGSTVGETRQQFYQALKEEVFTEWVDPPEPRWRVNPTTGIFEGNVTINGQPVDHAIVRVVGMPETETVTDGSGWYGILDVPPGPHQIEVVKPGVGAGERKVVGLIPGTGIVVTVNVEMDNTAVADWAVY